MRVPILITFIIGTVVVLQSELTDGLAVSNRKRAREPSPSGPPPSNREHNNEGDMEGEGEDEGRDEIPPESREQKPSSTKDKKSGHGTKAKDEEGFKYDAYISYRSSTSKHLAMLLKVLFERENVTAYLDVEDLYGGPRDEQLFNGIRNAPNFILVLSPGSLDRTINDPDFTDDMHQEIKDAVNLDRRIILVYDKYDFPAPEKYSMEIQDALRFQGIPWQHTLVDQSLARILSYFKTPRKLTSSHKHKLSPLHL